MQETIVVINGDEYVKRQPAVSENFVIVRCAAAGVHIGTLKSKDGNEVVLTNSRRVWYWSGAASLSQMSIDGVANPDQCKFPPPVQSITLLGVIEIIPCTEKAQKSLMGVPEWKK